MTQEKEANHLRNQIGKDGVEWAGLEATESGDRKSAPRVEWLSRMARNGVQVSSWGTARASSAQEPIEFLNRTKPEFGNHMERKISVQEYI